ncbi:hypothetical protein RHMOL_Rhmol07G0000700 [Rhododendron molle]|uniref:Uncharacterized protein n=1 Tax=Rhododendron molle TaxID=49168 RepID=A0ACC0MVW0_RHOML|nr:hypothetical protein RHMOL_Rhmol07G0000700 [Rhododendron molle]
MAKEPGIAGPTTTPSAASRSSGPGPAPCAVSRYSRPQSCPENTSSFVDLKMSRSFRDRERGEFERGCLTAKFMSSPTFTVRTHPMAAKTTSSARKADGADVEHLHDGQGGDAGAVEVRVLGEFFPDRVLRGGDLGDGDLAGVVVGVDGEGDVVAETVDGAAEEVEAGTKVGDGGRGEGPDGGEDGGGVNG